MPIVGQNDQLTGMLLQLMQARKARQDTQAANLINTLQPGETLASLGPGALKAFKRVTGQNADPNRVLKPLTVDDVLSTAGVSAFQGLTAEQKKAQGQNVLLNKVVGTTGVKTQAQYEDQRATGEAAARGQRRVVEAGATRLAATPEPQLAAAGEKQILGEGTQVTRTEEAKAKTGEQYNEYANTFLKDPANSAWGQTLTKAGLDPTAVTQAFATGQDSVLGGILQIKAIEAKSTGELTEYLQKARIDAAKKLEEDTGGAIPIRTSLMLQQAVESGQNPFEVGADSKTVSLWLKSKELVYSGYIRKAINTDNPQAQLLGNLLANMKNFPNLDQMNAANTVAAQTAAQLLTETQLGPRPGVDQPEYRAEWDKQARANYSTLGIIGKRIDTFLGMDKLNADATDITQQPDFMLPQVPVDTTGGRGGPDSTGARPKGPQFYDQSAASAVQGALNMGRDSSNVRGRSRGQGAAPQPGATAQNETVAQVIARTKDLPEAEYEAELQKIERLRGITFADDVRANTPAN